MGADSGETMPSGYPVLKAVDAAFPHGLADAIWQPLARDVNADGHIQVTLELAAANTAARVPDAYFSGRLPVLVVGRTGRPVLANSEC
jgi:hypothetical protein